MKSDIFETATKSEHVCLQGLERRNLQTEKAPKIMAENI